MIDLKPFEALVVSCDPGRFLPDEDLARAMAMISGEERARHDRFLVDQARREFLAGRVLMRTVLGGLAGLPPSGIGFEIGPKGKPSAPGLPPGIVFNLTHTRGYAAVAVALADAVGLDAEVVDAARSRSGIARRYFAPEEWGWLATLPDDAYPEAFFRLWTLKESLVKAHGGGIALGISRIRFDLGSTPIRCESEAGFEGLDGADYSFIPYQARAGVVGSVALRGASPEWRLREITIGSFVELLD